MILKGSQRAGAKQMALHLLKTEENEHVEIHDLRGFVADDLKAALQEAYAVSQGTRCKQFLFSLSLNPPETENVPVEVFEGAIDAIEQRLGLEGQPRAIVFHEKEGRRHAHCVWSRIDTKAMKAINLPHFKMKLRDISKRLYLENGWKMPLGLIDSRERDPTNFTRAEWQQAKRAGRDPKALKAMFQECWAASDSRKAFAKALEARGLYLARGDRRGFVAVDFRGEVYAIAKYTGVRTKDVKAKLGDPKSLPSLSEAKATIAGRMTSTVKRYIKEAETAFKKQSATLAFKKAQVTQRHQDERKRLDEAQQARWTEETNQRAARISRGFRGVWDRLTGKYARIRKQNEFEAFWAYRRDQDQRQAVVNQQLDERQVLQEEIARARTSHAQDREQLHRDVAYYMGLSDQAPPRTQDRLQEIDRDEERQRGRRRSRDDDFGPKL